MHPQTNFKKHAVCRNGRSDVYDCTHLKLPFMTKRPQRLVHIALVNKAVNGIDKKNRAYIVLFCIKTPYRGALCCSTDTLSILEQKLGQFRVGETGETL